MKPRQKRLAMIAGGLVALAVTAAFVLAAFQENLVFFFTPSQVAAEERCRKGARSVSAAWSPREV